MQQKNFSTSRSLSLEYLHVLQRRDCSAETYICVNWRRDPNFWNELYNLTDFELPTEKITFKFLYDACSELDQIVCHLVTLQLCPVHLILLHQRHHHWICTKAISGHRIFPFQSLPMMWNFFTAKGQRKQWSVQYKEDFSGCYEGH